MSLRDSMYSDSISIRKRDGTNSAIHKCSIQGSMIQSPDAKLEISAGDVVDRHISNGKNESYRILDVEYVTGIGGLVPDHLVLHVEKSGSLRPSGGRTTNNIHIENAHAIQIGDHNVQQLSSVLQSLVHSIDGSDADDEQKQEAKSLLKKFLEHPITSAAVGAGVGTLVKSIAG